MEKVAAEMAEAEAMDEDKLDKDINSHLNYLNESNPLRMMKTNSIRIHHPERRKRKL